MKTIAIAFLATLVGCVLSDQPQLPGLEDFCENTKPFGDFIDCVSPKMPETFKAAANKFLECVDEKSMVGLLDTICELIEMGIDKNELLPLVLECVPQEDISPAKVSEEEQQKMNAAFEQCLPHFQPYVQSALGKAAAQSKKRSLRWWK